MKMRALLFLYSFFPYEDANTVATLPLLDQLRQDCEVEIAAIDKDRKMPDRSEYDNITVNWIKPDSPVKRKAFILRMTPLSGKPLFKRLLLRLLRPLSTAYLRIFPENASRVTAARHAEKKFDLLVTVSAPIDTAYTASFLKRSGKLAGCKWIAVNEDPYASYISNHASSDELYAMEARLFSVADAVSLTPELYRGRTRKIFDSLDCDKVIVPVASLKEPLPCGEVSESDRPVCLYVGGFADRTIRDPENMLRVLSASDKTISNLVVNTLSSELAPLFEELLSGCDNVRLMPRMSHEDCLKLIKSADILLNVGNRSPNQLPSKLFEYISSGKPIVHFQTLADDPAAALLSRYPTSLILTSATSDDICKFEEFCRAAKGCHTPFDEVCRLYPEYTKDAVKAKFSELYRKK